MKKIDFESELKVLKENKFYRFSDLFFKKGIRWKSDRDTILEKDEYKHTILRKYLEQKTKEYDYDTIKKIIRKYISENNLEQPSSSELVIHLRCGDYFDKKEKNYWELTLKQKYNLYKLFEEKFHQFKNNKIEKISIVTALHFGANEINQKYFYSDEIYNENIIFLKDFENKINDLGYELSLVSNNDFDLDFCYMVNSKHFVKSVSQISNITERLLDKNSNVYN